jgi:GntR family transcriptional repressor for pyruvate dehydrogenase complex
LEANYEADQLDACIDADVAFHQVVAEASHNVMIGQLAASLMRVIHGHISRNLAHLHARPARWNELRAQHRAIWLAIRERRPEDAAAAARGHIEFVRQSMDDHARSDARRSVALRRQGQPVA